MHVGQTLHAFIVIIILYENLENIFYCKQNFHSFQRTQQGYKINDNKSCILYKEHNTVFPRNLAALRNPAAPRNPAALEISSHGKGSPAIYVCARALDLHTN